MFYSAGEAQNEDPLEIFPMKSYEISQLFAEKTKLYLVLFNIVDQAKV